MPDRHINFQHIDRFRRYLIREEKSAMTVEKYIRDAFRFLKWAGGRQITKDLTIGYKAQLQKDGYALRSVNSMLASLNGFLSFLGLADCKVKALRCQRQTYCTQDKELTKAEYLRLLDTSRSRPRLNLVLQTICSTGIRVSELQHFTLEAVRSGQITVQCKSKTRTILIPGKLKKLLTVYAKKRGIAGGCIFVTRSGAPLDRSNIWAQMKQLCAAARVDPTKVFPHNLRKLFARTFYGIEKDIAKLADILGHSSINTTRIYIMTTGTEHRRQIEQLGLVVSQKHHII